MKMQEFIDMSFLPESETFSQIAPSSTLKASVKKKPQ